MSTSWPCWCLHLTTKPILAPRFDIFCINIFNYLNISKHRLTVLPDWLPKRQSTGLEPRHDKTNKMSVRPAKTQISLGIHPVWSESSLCAQWVAKGPRYLHADSEDSDQTGRMPRLIWVFAGRTLTLLVLSCRGSHKREFSATSLFSKQSPNYECSNKLAKRS